MRSCVNVFFSALCMRWSRPMLRHPTMRRRKDNWELKVYIEITVSEDGWTATAGTWSKRCGRNCCGRGSLHRLCGKLRLSLEADQSQQIQAISLAAEILWIQGCRNSGGTRHSHGHPRPRYDALRRACLAGNEVQKLDGPGDSGWNNQLPKQAGLHPSRRGDRWALYLQGNLSPEKSRLGDVSGDGRTQG